jgi:hypothetical protein
MRLPGWHPVGVNDPYSYRRPRPEVGQVVAFEHRAWTVNHVQDADPTDEETDRLARIVEPYRTRELPYRVSLDRLYGDPHPWEKKPGRLALRVGAGGYGFAVYPGGRVPLCSCHQHPWPCLDQLQEQQAAEEAKKMAAELERMPGTCPSCGEVVTHRQQSITFGGPNVVNPLAEGPTYHLRRKCYRGAAAYEEKWVNDEPGRPRSLLTLRCEGSLTVHADGSADCHGAEDCPSIYAEHRGYSACYLQSHGCPRLECAGSRHGCHPTGRPSNPRDLHGRA